MADVRHDGNGNRERGADEVDIDLTGLPASVAYDLALSEYSANVPPREEVPSPREQERGADYEFKPAPPTPKLQRGPLRQRIAASLRKLNPRGIAGDEPVLPLVVLGLMGTVGAFDNTAFAFLAIFISADFDLDITFLIRLNSVLGTVALLVSPLGGYLADRVKRVWMIRIGSVIDNAAAILTGIAGGPAALVASRVVGGLGPAVSGPAVPAVMADYYPVDRRVRVFGFLSIVGQIWTLVSMGFLLYGFMVLGWTWRAILIGSGVVATGISLLTFFVKEPVRGKWDRLAMGASYEAAVAEQTPVGWAEAWRATRAIGTIRKLWYATPFLAVSGQATGLFMFFALQEKLVEVAGTELGGPMGFIANPANARFVPIILLVVPSLLNMFLVPYATSLADRMLQHRPGRIMYAAGILQGVTGVLTVASVLLPVRYMAVAFLANFVANAVASLLAPARTTLMSLVVPARIRAHAMQTVAPWMIVGNIAMFFVADAATTYSATTALLMLTPLMLIGSFILTTSGANVERDMRSALAASIADDETRAARKRGESKMVVARDVEVHYDGTQVLFGVDLDVEEGEILALLGTNGAGKSTLLRAIAGVQEASSGAIFLDGEDITHKPPHLNARDGIVFLPGGRAVFPTLSVGENLRTAAYLYADDAEHVATKTAEVLDLFPILRERLDDLAGNLSGGEQQMLGLGQAFLMKPRLLMIDELSLGLAPSIVERLLDVVRTVNEQGTTIILVEQSVNVALTVAERAIFMDKGEIRFDGPTEELLHRPDIVRAVFLGGTTGAHITRTARTEVVGDGDDAALDVSGITVRYGGVQALTDVTLTVAPGEIVGIVGPNGAGKTTLFDVVSGFTRPASGVVTIAGEDATRLSPDGRARLGLARSFQDTRLFPSLTVRESIAVALERRLAVRSPLLAAIWAPAARTSERRAFRKVDNLIDVLGLGGYADKFVNELSTGSRRIVDLGCIMAAEPRILLLDEPSSGMAQAEIEVLGPVVQRLARETGCGVLVIEHDLPLITAMSDRLVAMELGVVLADGEPDAVLSDPRVLSSYLSASKSVINRSGDLFGAAFDALGLDADDIDAPEPHPTDPGARNP